MGWFKPALPLFLLVPSMGKGVNTVAEVVVDRKEPIEVADVSLRG